MSFLHGSFIHGETRIAVSLVDREGIPHALFGFVRGSRHVTGSVHEVRLEFDALIDPNQFMMIEDTETVEDLDQPKEQLPLLSGVVVCVGSNVSEAVELRQHLSQLGLEVLVATNSGTLIDVLKLIDVDLIIVEENQTDPPLPELIETARDKGFRHTILTFINDEEEITKLQAAKHTAVLPLLNPVEPESFYTLLKSQIERSPAKPWAIYSEATRSEVLDNVPKCVTNLRYAKNTLDIAVERFQADKIAKACEYIADEAQHAGFDTIWRQARVLQNRLDDETDEDGIRTVATELSEMLRRVRNGPPQDPNTTPVAA